MRKLLPAVGVVLIIAGAWWMRSGPAPRKPSPVPKIAQPQVPPPEIVSQNRPPAPPRPVPNETTILGRVTSLGLPVPTCEVAMADMDPMRGKLTVTSNSVVKTKVDADGKFQFKGVDLGNYRITANAPGLALGWTDVEVRTTVDAIDIVIDLVPGPGLEVQVISGGKPVEATVSIWTTLPATEYNRKGRPLRSGPTINGLFIGEHLPRTSIILLVIAPGYRVHEQVLEFERGPILVTLEAGLTVKGSVVDSQGLPVSGVSITAAQGEAYIPECMSAADGSFSIGGLTMRSATLLLRKDGYDMVRLEVKVPSNGLVIKLQVLGVLDLEVDWPEAATLLLKTSHASFRHRISGKRHTWTNLPSGPAVLVIENGKGEEIGRMEVLVAENAPDTPVKVVPKKR